MTKELSPASFEKAKRLAGLVDEKLRGAGSGDGASGHAFLGLRGACGMWGESMYAYTSRASLASL